MTCILNLQIPEKAEAKPRVFANLVTLLVATRTRPDCLWIYLTDNEKNGMIEVVGLWTSKAAYEENLSWRVS